jgi:hypothetical protein
LTPARFTISPNANLFNNQPNQRENVMPAIDTIFGGKFQDSSGNVLVGGKITFQLSQEAQFIGGDAQVTPGYIISYVLDSFGSVPANSPLYGNDQLNPSGTYYIVQLFNAQGQLVAGPMNWQILGTSPIDLGTIISAGGGQTFLSGVVLLNPGTNQEILTGNLKIDNGLDVVGTFTDSTGAVGTSGEILSSTVTGTKWISSSGVGLTLETNGTANSNQGLLNIASGTGIAVANVSGTTTITNSDILSLETNGTSNSNQTLLNIAAGTGVSVSNASGTTTISTTGAALPSAQIGDIPRWNVAGDGAWDAVNGALKLGMIFPIVNNTTLSLNGTGFSPNLSVFSSTQTRVFPTTTDSGGYKQNSSSSASTSSVIGWTEGSGTAEGQYGFGSFYRWTFRFAAGNTTNARYWFGLCVYNTGGSGFDTIAPASSSRFAQDTTNGTVIGFRFSAGTDTNWQGVTQITPGTTQTLINTGVAIDTNPHTFEFTYDGTTVRFFIDNTSVGNSTTNLPSTSTVGVVQFMTGDNKNTANIVSGTTYHNLFSIK